jgi:hypothetical protein
LGGARSQVIRPVPEYKSAHYGDASFMDEPLGVTDLIPRRYAHIALLYVLGLAVIAGLELLHMGMPSLARYAGAGVSAFDLHGADSLAAWCSSTLLSLCGLVAILIYNVRRFRTDDYGGRYRIWLWAAICCFLASIDATANLHDAFKETLSRVAGTRILGDGAIWWVVIWLFVLGGVGLRLVVDMVECRVSVAVLSIAAVACLVPLAARFDLPLGFTGAGRVMFVEGAHLGGILTLLAALTLHARHVILDAEGLIHSDAEEEDEEEAAEEYDEIPIVNRSKPARTDLGTTKWGPPQAAHPAPSPPIKKPAPAVVSNPPVCTASGSLKSATSTSSAPTVSLAGGLGAVASPASKKLTKAEKKALRKRLLDMQRARE